MIRSSHFLIFTLLLLFVGSVQAQNNYNLAISTYIGGGGASTDDYGRDVSIDPSGNIYVVGATSSSNFPTLNAHDSSHNGSTDVFVRKYSPSGTLLWSTFLGGANYERAYACEFKAGDLYVAGRAGDGFPTTSGVVQAAFEGDNDVNSAYGAQDGFIAKFSADGVLQWSTYFGGPGREFIRDIDVDSEGNCYVGLASAATGFPHIVNAFDSSHNGGYDAIAAKINSSGTSVVYCSYLGGTGTDGEAPSVRVDSSGNLYFFTNGTYTNSNPATSGAYDTTVNGGSDFLLAKINAYTSGNVVLGWATYYGGSSSEITETHGLALDTSERPIIMGTTKSSNLPMEGSSYDSTHNGNAGTPSNYDGDIAVAIFSTDGTDLVVSTFYGGSDGEGGEGVYADSTGVYFTGGTQSTNIPTAGSPFQSSNGGGLDGFVVKLSAGLTSLLYASYIGGTSDDILRSMAIYHQRFYVAGEIASSNYDTRNAHQGTFGGGSTDAVLSVWHNTWPTTLASLDISTGQSGSTDIQVGTVAGSGRDIWGRSSGFRFLYDKAEYTTGNQDVQAFVSGWAPAQAYGKTGVMVAQTLRSDSKFASMVLTPSGAQFIYRQTRGAGGTLGSSVVLGGESLAIRAPYYVRVRRNGQDFSGWISTDTVSWTQVGSTVRINMAYDTAASKGPCYIGMVVSSHTDSATATATLANFEETFATANDWFYVSASQTYGAGAGTWASPYHLKQVFAGVDVAAITNSSTVWILEGTYNGRWHSRLTGASGARITVSSYPDELAILDGRISTTLSQAISDTGATNNVFFTHSNFVGGTSPSGSTTETFKIDDEQIKGLLVSETEVDVTLRGANGTTATTHSSGATVKYSGPAFVYDGDWVDYRNLEIAVLSSASRYNDTPTFSPFDRPTITDNLGSNNRLINCHVHDGGTSLTDQTGADNSEIYGCIVHSNGTAQVDGPAGHNLYIQADTPKSIKEVIAFNAFANQWNMSSTTAAVTLEGNIWFADTGSSLRTSSSLTVNACYLDTDGTQFGPDAGSSASGSITFTNNYMVAGAPITIGAFSTGGTFTGNTSVGGSASGGNNLTIRQTSGDPTTTEWTISNNLYFRRRQGLKATLDFGGTDYCYNSSHTGTGCTGTRWQDLTGASSSTFDPDGTYQNDQDTGVGYHEDVDATDALSPSADAVFMRVNTYNANRANVAAWDWGGNGNISLNPSGFLSSGDIFVVIFAGNYKGDPVVGPTLYTSGNVTISMALREMAAPIGWTQRPSDESLFKAFVIRKL